MRSFAEHRLRAISRVALSHYVANGLSVALGLLLVSAAVHAWLGAAAAAAASVGVIVCAPPDLPGPRRGKLWQMVPAPLLGIPLFFAVQWLYPDPVRLGLLLVPGTFVAFLIMAWGKRGIPVAVAVMFSMVFSMAAAPRVPPGGDPLPAALAITAHFALGAWLYVAYALVANHLLNARYRVQLVADALLSLAALMRVQARQFDAAPLQEADTGTTAPASLAAAGGTDAQPLTGLLLLRQAALAEQLQSARNIVLEAPTTPARQRLAGMLLLVLEMRDHLLACELDVDALKAHPGHVPVLHALRGVLQQVAQAMGQLSDALLVGRRPPAFTDLRPALSQVRWSDPLPPDTFAGGPSPQAMARSLADRIGHINDEALRMVALARNEATPDLAAVRAGWQMFVSPTAWSLAPLTTVWRWDAPPLRHAVRAALAMAAGFVVAQALPWGTHAYWILLTIVVVLRGSLAQTLERRNSRVGGTLLGCALAAALLAAHLSAWQLVLCLTVAQAVAHGFAVRRYLITAVAATVLGLVQSHMLHGGASPGVDLLERLADTLIGTGIAWAFSYVLPSWERSQIPALIDRALAAQARHAREALALGQLQAVDNAPELAWRLARREAYDSLSALVQATQRSLAEPRAVQPPLAALERLQARCYQLLAQLTAIKTLLLLRRGRLDAARLQVPLAHTADTLTHLLEGPADAVRPADPPADPAQPDDAQRWPDPHDGDLGPWMVRRLGLAIQHAAEVRAAAREAAGLADC
ncbi:FUSC family protein [Acidovorax sp. GBBC 3334]|uniref:FUSC family protein n=1 Tax=Acidovorax sp. GBBC 3334 TaxID=2940496 RepID=UPI002302E25D|nr:FUSC family protein [Acidovorax sp. GBBC 3334]MDA8455361.1 FUSC family protein [Acidovorax sp. GBBC 3334]